MIMSRLMRSVFRPLIWLLQVLREALPMGARAVLAWWQAHNLSPGWMLKCRPQRRIYPKITGQRPQIILMKQCLKQPLGRFLQAWLVHRSTVWARKIGKMFLCCWKLKAVAWQRFISAKTRLASLTWLSLTRVLQMVLITQLQKTIFTAFCWEFLMLIRILAMPVRWRRIKLDSCNQALMF